MNLLEWSNFVINIPDEELIEIASFLGSQGFIDSMLDKGVPIKDIAEIHKLVAQKFIQNNRLLPHELPNCAVNYYNILNPPTIS